MPQPPTTRKGKINMRVTIDLHYLGHVILTDITHVYPLLHDSTHHAIDVTDLINKIKRQTLAVALPPESHRPTLDDLPAVG